MSMSANAEESDANQAKFYRVVSSEPVTDADALFDTLSKFLMKDKKRQLSTEYLDEKDQISSRLTWSNLRNVANTVLDEGCSQLDPVPAWIEQKEPIVVDDEDNDNETPHKQETSDTDDVPTKEEETDASSQQSTAASDTIIEDIFDSAQKGTKEDKKEAKKAKKEAKEARKRERAEQREMKKERKEAKKLKKEAKKRKRDE